jgi:hypothetical protein
MPSLAAADSGVRSSIASLHHKSSDFVVPSSNPRSQSKDCKRERALERNNAVSEGAQLIGSGLVHHQGTPIKLATNAGFKRRREPRGFGEDGCPSVSVGWPGRKECSRKFGNCSPFICPPPVLIGLRVRAAIVSLRRCRPCYLFRLLGNRDLVSRSD